MHLQLLTRFTDFTLSPEHNLIQHFYIKNVFPFKIVNLFCCNAIIYFNFKVKFAFDYNFVLKLSYYYYYFLF